MIRPRREFEIKQSRFTKKPLAMIYEYIIALESYADYLEVIAGRRQASKRKEGAHVCMECIYEEPPGNVYCRHNLNMMKAGLHCYAWRSKDG